MALTFTLAGLQAELDAAATAAGTGDYAGARVQLLDAALVLAGLPESFDVDGAKAKLRGDLDRVGALVDAAEAAAASSDRRRLIRTEVAHRGGRARAR